MTSVVHTQEQEKAPAGTDETNETKHTPAMMFENWDDLTIPEELLRGIFAYGFDNPSPIQQKAILPFQQGLDILAQAQSGTGKTGTFTIGTLLRVDPFKPTTQAILLAPTRELARQIHGVISALSQQMSLRIALVIGGTNVQESSKQFTQSKTCPHIVVGTPGRVTDFLTRRIIQGNTVNMLVLDEADEMLSKGFKQQIYEIFQQVHQDVQVGLFSATIPRDVEQLTERFMRNPVKILVHSDMLTLKGIKQYYIALSENEQDKLNTLKDLFGDLSISQCIIYCNTVERVIHVYEDMVESGFPVAQIHSHMTEDERKQTYEEFKAGKHRVLISSNLTARGIDIQQVSIVINFDIPFDHHTYLHRIGRSGRYGRKGVAINFVTKNDVRAMREIEQYYDTSIEELPSTFMNDL